MYSMHCYNIQYYHNLHDVARCIHINAKLYIIALMHFVYIIYNHSYHIKVYGILTNSYTYI